MQSQGRKNEERTVLDDHYGCDDGWCDSGSFEFGSVPDLIFSDGFESGDTSAWSLTGP